MMFFWLLFYIWSLRHYLKLFQCQRIFHPDAAPFYQGYRSTVSSSKNMGQFSITMYYDLLDHEKVINEEYVVNINGREKVLGWYGLWLYLLAEHYANKRFDNFQRLNNIQNKLLELDDWNNWL